MVSPKTGTSQFQILLAVCFLLLFGASLSSAPAAPSATVEICFAPENDCAVFATRAIDRAERQILVGAYGLTTGRGLSKRCCVRTGAASRSS
jgi:hypothetical protein